eukprot:jgi/Astpho2/1514/fgenesh1_pm.00026_%23_16_t
MASLMQQAQQQVGPARSQAAGAGVLTQGATLDVASLHYHPAGAQLPLLQDVSLHLPANQLGLIYGRSGAGKTTLLQLIAGLAEPTTGAISAMALQLEGLQSQRMADVGLVFQFPERHFLGATVGQELSFGWSVPASSTLLHVQKCLERLALPLVRLGSTQLYLDCALQVLSDGYKRRVALAVQLVRQPKILLLDEPLAGLDWQTRAEVATTLAELKRRCTVLVVSHDLRELVPLVDVAWQVKPGGKVQIAELPLL